MTRSGKILLARFIPVEMDYAIPRQTYIWYFVAYVNNFQLQQSISLRNNPIIPPLMWNQTLWFLEEGKGRGTRRLPIREIYVRNAHCLGLFQEFHRKLHRRSFIKLLNVENRGASLNQRRLFFSRVNYQATIVARVMQRCGSIRGISGKVTKVFGNRELRYNRWSRIVGVIRSNAPTIEKNTDRYK